MNVANRMMQLAGTVARKFNSDGWANILTGLGIAGKDKRMSATYQWIKYHEGELENIYTDAGARRVVEYVPNQGTQEWIEVRREDAEDTAPVKMLNDEFERLRVKEMFNKAWTWARLYGGSGVLVVVDDGKELSEPLVPTEVRSIKSLVVLNRFELPTWKLNYNLESPDFGKQELYDLAPRATTSDLAYGIPVHHTRVIRFDGLPLPRRLFQMNDHWDESILPKMLNALRNYNSSHDSMSAALSDFRLTILKLKNLADMVGSDDDQALLTRLQLMNTSKSILNSIAIDADAEDVTHLETNFANLDKVLEKVEARLVADTDLSHTVVLGEGAEGTLSGGGESESRNDKAYVASQQDKVLAGPIKFIFELVQLAKAGPFRGSIVKDLTWEFNPLEQQSESEKAATHKTQAEADAMYLDRGVLSPETVARSRFGGSEYSTETQMEEAFDDGSEVGPKKEGDPEPKEDYSEEISGDHAHSGYIDKAGFFYTGGANGEGDNHTHTMPNGVETGPAIALFGGGHNHQIAQSGGGNGNTDIYSSPAFPLAQAEEVQVITEEAKENSPVTVELELDLKTGKLTMKGIAADRLETAYLVKDAFTADQLERYKKRFDKVTVLVGDEEIKANRTNIKGVYVKLREGK